MTRRARLRADKTARFPSPPTKCPEQSARGMGYTGSGPHRHQQNRPVPNVSDKVPRAVPERIGQAPHRAASPCITLHHRAATVAGPAASRRRRPARATAPRRGRAPSTPPECAVASRAPPPAPARAPSTCGCSAPRTTGRPGCTRWPRACPATGGPLHSTRTPSRTARPCAAWQRAGMARGKVHSRCPAPALR